TSLLAGVCSRPLRSVCNNRQPLCVRRRGRVEDALQPAGRGIVVAPILFGTMIAHQVTAGVSLSPTIDVPTRGGMSVGERAGVRGEFRGCARVLRPPHPSFGHLLPRFPSITCHRRTGGEGLRSSPHSSCRTALGSGCCCARRLSPFFPRKTGSKQCATSLP